MVVLVDGVVRLFLVSGVVFFVLMGVVVLFTLLALRHQRKRYAARRRVRRPDTTEPVGDLADLLQQALRENQRSPDTSSCATTHKEP